MSQSFVAGLEGVVAAETRLSRVDGQKGELIIAGYALEEIAPRATFEQLLYLLWFGALPTAEELTDWQATMAAQRAIPPATYTLLEAIAQQNQDPMLALRMAAGTADLLDETSGDLRQEGASMAAKLPTIVAAYARLQAGQSPIAPNPALSHAANFLYMLTGDEPRAEQVRGLQTYWNSVVDHGLNASTFTARVIIATRSDLASAVVGAIGALKGPLHGGAPGPALDMVREIGTLSRADEVIRAKLAKGERLMGFGHRVYKVRDPRAAVLAEAAEALFATASEADKALYSLAKGVEDTAVRLLAEHKPGRNLQTNVEFYTALLLHGLGLESDLFSPTFALGRIGGWVGHCLEQAETGRLIRPKSRYVGVVGRRWGDI